MSLSLSLSLSVCLFFVVDVDSGGGGDVTSRVLVAATGGVCVRSSPQMSDAPARGCPAASSFFAAELRMS